MAFTTKFNSSTNGVSQNGSHWCIPASIENLLRAEGVNSISQEDLIYEFFVRNVKDLQSNNGVVSVSSIPKDTLLAAFRNKPIPGASFQTFAPVANAMLKAGNHSIELDYVDNINDQSVYVEKLVSIIEQDKPVLIAAQSPGGFHITICYECDGTSIKSYDPEQDLHLTDKVSNYKFSHDMLFIK